MSRRYLLKLVIVCTLFSLLAGCGGGKVVKPSDESIKATASLNTLKAMEASYVARDLAGVIKPLAQDFKGGYSEFQTSVRKDIETFPQVSLDIYTDRVELEGDLVKVVFHWFGKWHGRDGQEREGRGNCVFVFKAAGDASSLYDIVGDSPFGVIR